MLLLSSSMNRHGNVAHDYVSVISKMIYDEPCIFGMISMLQGFCLRHGIIVRWGQAPPTPAFQAHIQKYFVPFCKQAIQSFLAVGFAPFRIRREGPQALLVPEVLPLGTYTWCVNNARRSKRRSARGSSELLFYDVTSSYCDSEEEIYVFNYMQPHATLNCYSPLSSLIPQYNSLITTREYALQATCWNAKPKMALEEQDKVMLNSIAESGSCISQISQSNPIAQGLETDARFQRQETMNTLLEVSKEQSNLPPESIAFIAPKNNSIKPLERLEAPPDMLELEANFVRNACRALGIPTSIHEGSRQGSNKSAWSDGPEMHQRVLAEGCLKLNQALQGLLTMAYELIYEDSADSRAPTFSIPLAPNLPYELLLPLFDAQVLDETAYNRLFEASVGFSLGEHALKAREDRHKALTVVKTAASGSAAKKE